MLKYSHYFIKRLEDKINKLADYPDFTDSAQVSQYLSMTVVPSTSKYAVSVAILPQFTQNLVFLPGSFVKDSTDRKVFNI